MSLILRQIFVGNSKITGSLPNPHYSPIGNSKIDTPRRERTGILESKT
jgi:hypothetical protein